MFELLLPLLSVCFLAPMCGYFSLMKTALTESSHGKIEKLANDGNKNAESALKLLDATARPIAVTQIFNILAGTGAGVCIFPMATTILREINFSDNAAMIAVAGTVIFVVFMMIFFGRFLPTRIAEQSPEEYLLEYNRSFKFFVRIMSPVVIVFSKIAGLTMMILGMNPDKPDTVTEEEVKDLIEQGTEDGTFEESEKEMVDKIFHLSDQTAYDLMIPRVRMDWLDISDGAKKIFEVIRKSEQKIFPVAEGDLDEFKGIIYAKDLLDAFIEREKVGGEPDLNALIKKPLFVPRTMETFRIVEKFKNSGEFVAIVNDEYGGVTGMITGEIIAKEIIGMDDDEIFGAQKFFPKKENSRVIDGLCDIDDFKELYDLEILPNEEEDRFKTMGGFVTALFGYIPKVGEFRDWNGMRFKVLKMDRARIAEIEVTKISEHDKTK